MVVQVSLATQENGMSKNSGARQAGKQHSIVAKKVVVSQRGAVVQVTRLELSSAGSKLLQSKSNGIGSPKDKNEPVPFSLAAAG